VASPRTLLIIDIQRDYFPGGAYPLVEPEAAAEAARQNDRNVEEPPGAPVTLGQRAFPLIEMLRAAEKRKVDVTWGV